MFRFRVIHARVVTGAFSGTSGYGSSGSSGASGVGHQGAIALRRWGMLHHAAHHSDVQNPLSCIILIESINNIKTKLNQLIIK